jgi:hypothetical protein
LYAVFHPQTVFFAIGSAVQDNLNRPLVRQTPQPLHRLRGDRTIVKQEEIRDGLLRKNNPGCGRGKRHGGEVLVFVKAPVNPMGCR